MESSATPCQVHDSTPFTVDFSKSFGVDAIAQAGWLGAVGEDVAEVGIADVAGDLDTNHAMTVVSVVSDHGLGLRLGEGWPTRSAVKFFGGIEKRDVAAGAGVFSSFDQAAHFGAEWHFGSVLTSDAILIRCQLRLPFFVCFFDPAIRLKISVFGDL